MNISHIHSALNGTWLVETVSWEAGATEGPTLLTIKDATDIISECDTPMVSSDELQKSEDVFILDRKRDQIPLNILFGNLGYSREMVQIYQE